MKVWVVSTGFNPPTGHLCVASVAAQVGVDCEHIVVNAAEQYPPKPASQNLYEACQGIPPEDVIAWVDADDWLAKPDALARVAKWYADDSDLLLSYGSFIDSAGVAPTWMRAYPPDADVREHEWMASHLRTFKAGLFQRLTPEDLQLDGEWLSLGVDQAVMLPMREKACYTRRHFCPVPLVVYNVATSWGAHARPADLDREAEVVARVRAKARKVRM